MSWAFVLQTLVSAFAVAALVGLAAWARIAAPRPPLDEAAARALIADEFPGEPIDAVHLAADGKAAVARSGARALIVYLRGDDYVARTLPWSDAVAAEPKNGAVRLVLRDIAAPAARLAFTAWPPAADGAA
jgi:hypothetical protein